MTMQNSKLNTIQSYSILIILFVLPAYLIKLRFDWVSFNILELLISFLFLVWLFQKDTKYEIRNTKYTLPILLIFIGLALSTLANKNYYSGLGAIKGWFLFPIIFAIIFYDQLKKDDGLLKKSLAALFFSGFAISLFGVIYKFLGILTFDGRLKIFWDSPNQLAMFLAVPLLIGVILNIPRLSLGMGIGLMSIAINLYLTKSFGAWLAIAVSLSIYFWLKYSKIWQKKYIAVFLIIFLIFIGWAGFDKFENIKNLGDRSSLASRTIIWESAVLMIQNNPLFGIGPGNFQNKYLEYQKYFPPYLEWSVPQPHNLFMTFWLESGLVGLIGFIWILFFFFRDHKRATRTSRNPGVLFLGIIIYC